MISSAHFLAGAAIGRFSGNPILAAVLGLFFHFLMDVIPHWDWGYRMRKTAGSFLIAGIELLTGAAILVWVVFTGDFSRVTIINMFVGGIFSLLPDIASVLSKTFKIKALKPLVIFHERCHWFIDYKGHDAFEWWEIKISPKGIFLGILYQIPFIVISIYLIMR